MQHVFILLSLLFLNGNAKFLYNRIVIILFVFNSGDFDSNLIPKEMHLFGHHLFFADLRRNLS